MELYTHNISGKIYRLLSDHGDGDGEFIRIDEAYQDLGHPRVIKMENMTLTQRGVDPSPDRRTSSFLPEANGDDETTTEESVPSPNGEGSLVTIDPDQPWAGWEVPDQHMGMLNNVIATERDGAIQLALVDPDSPTDDWIALGSVGGPALKQMSSYCGFPVDFVQKLPAALRAEVITDRARTANYHGFTFLTRHGELTNLMPDWREILPYSHAAQFAYDRLRSRLGDVTVEEARIGGERMRLLLFTPVERPITPAVGDILQLGLEVRHDYSRALEVQVYARRLACINGMTTLQQQFQWTHRTLGTAEHQLNWLGEGIDGAIRAYDELVQRATLMAQTRFEGEAHTVLAERARALRIANRLVPRIMDAFDQEPGETEWHLVNAITRFGTHSEDISDRQRDVLLNTAGEFTRQFELVDARLPQHVAQRVGAHIIRQIEETTVNA
jgi:hypothetical protein